MDKYEAIAELQRECYQAAADKGFHREGDRLKAIVESDAPGWAEVHEGNVRNLANYRANKLMLIVGEAVEAHEELRAGRGVVETYYPTAPYAYRGPLNTGVRETLHKPEGIPSELADIVIRVLDFAGSEGIDLAGMIREKLAFNATRPDKHGKQF